MAIWEPRISEGGDIYYVQNHQMEAEAEEICRRLKEAQKRGGIQELKKEKGRVSTQFPHWQKWIKGDYTLV